MTIHKRKKIAYVAGPYSGKNSNVTHWNIQRARGIAESLILQGFAVFCPHMNFQHMDGLVENSEFLDSCLEILRRCDFVVVTDNWQDSPGACEEVALAKQLEIPVMTRKEALENE